MVAPPNPPIHPAVKAAGALGIAFAIVSGFEGLYTYAYRDPVGIPTICFGHIENVKMGDHETAAQCKDLLITDLARYDAEMLKCVHVPLPDKRHAALLSFSYNVGTQGFCKSTLNRKLNAGDVVGACDELLRWNHAGPLTLPGLTKRRQDERQLCLQED